MRQIRYNTFETNSSSVHTLVLANKEQYDKFSQGLLYLDDGDFVTKEEILSRYGDKYGVTEDSFKDYVKEERMSFNTWFPEEYESFVETHTTPGGETVVAFGYTGYDN